ncbi:carboxymuconolactone decarboxylase family protein [Paenibacillus sp. FSL W8-0439]|uniref:carboxymuconolactone decarboxylase family protein n=1 Tax=Paenibacillus sp. FSL W8-0439 TaxID=2921716 RepID=UPI0030F79CBE
MNQESLYKKSYINRLGEFNKLSGSAFQAFMNFDQKSLNEGVLSTKLKELMAVAVAHVTGCPYCIEIHVNKVKKEATKEEMAEAIMVATALKAGSAMAHGVNALNAYDNNGDDELYKASYFERIKEYSSLASDAFKSFVTFDVQTMKAGALSVKEKELIAIAIAHVTGCPYCIQVHVKAAKKAQVTKEEMAEAIMVATALKAGSAMAHGVNALNAYDEL